MGKKILYPVVAVAAVLFSIIYSFISNAVTAGSHQAAGMTETETTTSASLRKIPETSVSPTPNQDTPAAHAATKKQAAPQASRTTKSS